MIDTIDGQQSILYIQTQLDETSPYDDFANNIAYNYSEESQEDDTPEVLNGIVIDPAFDTVRQNYTVNFEANLYIDGVKQSDEIFASTSGAPDWTYEFNSLGNNMFSVRCKKVAQIPLMITLTNGIVSQNVIVDLASMF